MTIRWKTFKEYLTVVLFVILKNSSILELDTFWSERVKKELP